MDIHEYTAYNSHMYSVNNYIYITYYLGTVLSTMLLTIARTKYVSHQHTNIPTRVTSPPNFFTKFYRSRKCTHLYIIDHTLYNTYCTGNILWHES